MKKLIVILACVFLIDAQVAQSTSPGDRYLEAMQKCITQLYHASDISDLQNTVNTLERIASAETGKWEPHYYTAFGYLMMAAREKDAKKKDAFLDQAATAVAKANELLPNDSEIISLEGFVYMLRLTVDPASRGQELAPRAMEAFGKARHLNPENPRAIALSAQMQFGSATFFGNSTAEACALARTSITKFDVEKPKTQLAPTWGKAMAESLLAQCQ
jgi:hypothetical protein